MKRRWTYPEAAEELRVDVTWLKRHIKELPHSKKGRVVTFSDEDLERIDAIHHHEPTVGPLARPVAIPAVPPTGHPLAALRPLPARARRAS